MPRKPRVERPSGNIILLVDDSLEYLEMTRLILAREGHEILTAVNGPEALAILHATHVDLLLLDYYMPGMTGEEVVGQLRQFNQYVQVILQTGYASEQPPRELLHRLDIQGYCDKSEGPEKLLLWTDVGLKMAYTIQLLQKSRQGLRYILDITPELHKIQPLSELLQGILWQVAGLLGAANTFLATLPEDGVSPSPTEVAEGFVAMTKEDTDLVIQASTGRFLNNQRVDQCLDPEQVDWICRALQQGAIQRVGAQTIVPLHVGELRLGVIYLDRLILAEQDVELVQLFANQTAVAIQNAQLYEMATFDPLTGVYVRRFFEQWLQRELRSAFRTGQSLSLLMIDLDCFKQINDEAGHLVGDQALVLAGKVLEQATRSGDIVGRYGGDEFVMILPNTPTDEAVRAGQRILEALAAQGVSSPTGDLPLRSSVGVGSLRPHNFSSAMIPRPIPHVYFQQMSTLLFQQADWALYQAKQTGRNRIHSTEALTWTPMDP